MSDVLALRALFLGLNILFIVADPKANTSVVKYLYFVSPRSL